MNKSLFCRIVSGIMALSIVTFNVPAVFAESGTAVDSTVYNGAPVFSIAEGEDYNIYYNSYSLENSDVSDTQAQVLFSTVPNPEWVATLSAADIRNMYWIDSAVNATDDDSVKNKEELTNSLSNLSNEIEFAKSRVNFAKDSYLASLVDLESQTEALYSKIAGSDVQIGLDLYLALNDESSTINKILSGEQTAYAFIWGSKRDAETNSLIYNYMRKEKIPVKSGSSGVITTTDETGKAVAEYNAPMSPSFPSKVFDFDVERSQETFVNSTGDKSTGEYTPFNADLYKTILGNSGAYDASVTNYFKNYTPVVKPAWYGIQFTKDTITAFSELKAALGEWVPEHEKVVAINAVPLLNDYFVRDTTYFKPTGYTDMQTVSTYFEEAYRVMMQYLRYMNSSSTKLNSFMQAKTNNNNNSNNNFNYGNNYNYNYNYDYNYDNNYEENSWRDRYDNSLNNLLSSIKFVPTGEWVPVAQDYEKQRNADLDIKLSVDGKTLDIPEVSLTPEEQSKRDAIVSKKWYQFMYTKSMQCYVYDRSVGLKNKNIEEEEANYKLFLDDGTSSQINQYNKLVRWYANVAAKYGFEYANRGVSSAILKLDENNKTIAVPYFLTKNYTTYTPIVVKTTTNSMKGSNSSITHISNVEDMKFGKFSGLSTLDWAASNVTDKDYKSARAISSTDETMSGANYIDVHGVAVTTTVGNTTTTTYKFTDAQSAYTLFFQNIMNYNNGVTEVTSTSNGTTSSSMYDYFKFVRLDQRNGNDREKMVEAYKTNANIQYEGYCDTNVMVEPALGTVTYSVDRNSIADPDSIVTVTEKLGNSETERDYVFVSYDATKPKYSRPKEAVYTGTQYSTNDKLKDTSTPNVLARNSNFIHTLNLYDSLLDDGLSTLYYSDYIMNIASGLQFNLGDSTANDYKDKLVKYSDNLSDHSMSIDAGGLGMDFFTALEYLPLEFYGGAKVDNDTLSKYTNSYSSFMTCYKNLEAEYKNLLKLLQDNPLYAAYAIADNPEDKYNLDNLTQIGIEYDNVVNNVNTKEVMAAMLKNQWDITANMQTAGKMAEITPFITADAYTVNDSIRNVGADILSADVINTYKNPIHPKTRQLTEGILKELWNDYNYVAGNVDLPDAVKLFASQNSGFNAALNKVKTSSAEVALTTNGVTVQVYQYDTVSGKTVLYPAENTSMFNSCVKADNTVNMSEVFTIIQKYEYDKYVQKVGAAKAVPMSDIAWYSETEYNNRYKYVVLLKYLYSNKSSEPWLSLPSYFTLDSTKDVLVSEVSEYAISEYYDSLENVPSLSTSTVSANEVFAVTKLSNLITNSQMRDYYTKAGVSSVLDVASGPKAVSFIYKLRDISKIAKSFNVTTVDAHGNSTAKIVTNTPKRAAFATEEAYLKALADQWTNLLSVYSYYAPYQEELFGKSGKYYNADGSVASVTTDKAGTGYTYLTKDNAHKSLTTATGETITYQDAIDNIYNYHILRYEQGDTGKSYRTVQRILLDIEPFFNILSDSSRKMTSFSTDATVPGYDLAISEHTLYGPDYRPDLRWTENGELASYYYTSNNGPTDKFPMDFYQWVSKTSAIDGLYLFTYADENAQKEVKTTLSNIEGNEASKTYSSIERRKNENDTNYHMILGGVKADNRGELNANIQLSSLKYETNAIVTDISYSDWIFSKSVKATSDVYLCLSCGMLLYKEVLHDHFMQEGPIVAGWSQIRSSNSAVVDTSTTTGTTVALDLAPEVATDALKATYTVDTNGQPIIPALPYLVGWKMVDGVKQKVLVPAVGTYTKVDVFYKDPIPFYYSPIDSNLQLSLGLRHTSVYHMTDELGAVVYIEPIPLTAEDNFNYYAYYNAVLPLVEGTVAGLHAEDKQLAQPIKSLKYIDDSSRVEYYFDVVKVNVPGNPIYETRVVASCPGPFVNVLNWNIDSNYGLDDAVVDVIDTTVNINTTTMSESQVQEYIKTIWDKSSREEEDKKKDDNKGSINTAYVNAFMNVTGNVIPGTFNAILNKSTGTRTIHKLVEKTLDAYYVGANGDRLSLSDYNKLSAVYKNNYTRVEDKSWEVTEVTEPYSIYSIATTVSIMHNTYDEYGAGTIIKNAGASTGDITNGINTNGDFEDIISGLYADIALSSTIRDIYNGSSKVINTGVKNTDVIPKVDGIIKGAMSDGLEITKDRINTSRRSELAYTSGAYRLLRNYKNTDLSNMSAVVRALSGDSVVKQLSLDDMLILSTVSENSSYLIPLSILTSDVKYFNNIGLAGLYTNVNRKGNTLVYDTDKHCYTLTLPTNTYEDGQMVTETIDFTGTQLSDSNLAMSRLLSYGWTKPYLASDSKYGYFITSNYWGVLTRDSLDSLLKATRSVSTKMASVVDFNNMVMTLPSTINSTGGLPRITDETMSVGDYSKYLQDACNSFIKGVSTYYTVEWAHDEEGNQLNVTTLEQAKQHIRDAAAQLRFRDYPLVTDIPEDDKALTAFEKAWKPFIVNTTTVTKEGSYELSSNWLSAFTRSGASGSLYYFRTESNTLGKQFFRDEDEDLMIELINAVCEYLNVLERTAFKGIDFGTELKYNEVTRRYESYVVRNSDGSPTFMDSRPADMNGSNYYFIMLPAIFDKDGNRLSFYNLKGEPVNTSRNLVIQQSYNGMYLNYNYDATDMAEAKYSANTYYRQDAIKVVSTEIVRDMYNNETEKECISYETSTTDIDKFKHMQDVVADTSNKYTAEDKKEAEEYLSNRSYVCVEELFDLAAMPLIPFIVVDVSGALTIQDVEAYTAYDGMSIYSPYIADTSSGSVEVNDVTKRIKSVYSIVKYSYGDSVYKNVSAMNDSSAIMSKHTRGSEDALKFNKENATYFTALGSGSKTDKSYELIPNRSMLLISDRLVRIKQGTFEYIGSKDDWNDNYTKPETSTLATGAGVFTPLIFIDNLDVKPSNSYFVPANVDSGIEAIVGYQFDNTYHYDVQEDAKKQSNAVLHTVYSDKAEVMDALMDAQLKANTAVDSMFKILDGSESTFINSINKTDVDIKSYGYNLVPEVLMTYKTGFRYVDDTNKDDVIRWIKPDFSSTAHVKPNISPAYAWAVNNWSDYYTITTGNTVTTEQLRALADAYARAQRGNIKTAYVAGYDNYTMALPAYNKISLNYNLVGDSVNTIMGTITLNGNLAESDGNAIKIGSTGIAMASGAKKLRSVVDVKNPRTWAANKGTYSVDTVPVILTGSTMTANMLVEGSVQFDSWVTTFNPAIAPDFLNPSVNYGTMGKTMADAWLKSLRTDGKYIMTADMYNTFVGDKVSDKDILNTSLDFEIVTAENESKDYEKLSERVTFEVRNARLAIVRVEKYTNGAASGLVNSYSVYADGSLISTQDFYNATTKTETEFDGLKKLANEQPDVFRAICEMHLVEFAGTLRDTTEATAGDAPQNFASVKTTDTYSTDMVDGTTGKVEMKNGKPVAEKKTVEEVVNEARKEWGQTIDTANSWYQEDTTIFQIEHYTKTLTLPTEFNFSWKIPIGFGPKSSGSKKDLYKIGWLGKVNVGVRFGKEDYAKFDIMGTVYNNGTSNVEPYSCFKISAATVNDR